MTARQAKRVSVLVVENEPATRALVSRLLHSLGVGTIPEAPDGRQALEILDELTVDLVISDLEMPKMNGIELTQALRGRGDRTPVIMLSGQDDDRVIARAKRAGVSEYMLKPIDSKALTAVLERILFGQMTASARPSTLGLSPAKTRRRRSA